MEGILDIQRYVLNVTSESLGDANLILPISLIARHLVYFIYLISIFYTVCYTVRLKNNYLITYVIEGHNVLYLS